MLQKIRTGDIDFMISSTANAATAVAAIRRDVDALICSAREDHLINAPRRPARGRRRCAAMFDDTVKGAPCAGAGTLGLRNLYGKKEIHNVDDIKGLKVRVQATPTEDTMFPAYGAQTVHMPFGSVYTSLQTGVVDMAENGINVYLANKHYEVAPVMSLTEHEANNCVIWVSDKVWISLTAEQKGWVQAAADEVSRTQPRQGARAGARSRWRSCRRSA